MLTLLLVILALLFLGAIPLWPYSKGWGYWPATILGIVFILLLIFMLAGR